MEELKKSLQKAIALLKEGNNDGTVEALESAVAEVEALEATPPAVPAEEEITKMVEVELKKYADLYVSASDFKELMENLKEVTDKMSGMESLMKTQADKLEALEKTEKPSKQLEEAELKKSARSQNGNILLGRA